MKAGECFYRKFAGLSGGASGFGDPEFAEIVLDESEVPRTGLSMSSLQSMAHRQLIGSIVVLGAIAIFAAFTVLRPGHTASIAAVNHPFPSVQQPIMETRNSDRLAAIKYQTELP